MPCRRAIDLLASALVVALAAGFVAACGSGGGAPARTRPKSTSGSQATLGVRKTSLGNVLVDSHGHTLYLFRADLGTKSECTGACATAWPPVLAHGKPTVGAGASGSLLGTAKRSNGAQQVTYHGHPLYLFVKDQNPGDVTGQGVSAFGAAWFVISPAGNQISAPASSTRGGGSAGGSTVY